MTACVLQSGETAMSGAAFARGFRDYLASYGFTIIRPGDGSLLWFSSDRWQPESFLARRGDEIWAPFVATKASVTGGIAGLVHEVEWCGLEPVFVEPTDRIAAIAEKRWGFTFEHERVGEIPFKVGRRRSRSPACPLRWSQMLAVTSGAPGERDPCGRKVGVSGPLNQHG